MVCLDESFFCLYDIMLLYCFIIRDNFLKFFEQFFSESVM